MKLSKKIMALVTGVTLTSSIFAVDYVHNKKVAIPDTSSKVVTSAQDINKKLSAVEFSKQLGNGINLGNTMEAYRGDNMSTTEPATKYESLWGQPVTTEKMIKGYKAAGFDTIRIPVAWTNAIDYKAGDYRINKDYLDRVETIVNWALNAGMNVIINDHWDGGWWGLFGQRDAEYRNDAIELYKAMWTQIGTRFKNYSYKLIFEGGNEEIGSRLNDDNASWGKGSLNEDGCYKMANYINQTFVDLIRAQGGNNANRFLLIPGYDTNINKTCDDRFVMPKDSAKNKLFVSVHYYDPSDFCIGGGDLWGEKSEYEYQNKQLAKMGKFVKQGYGVIIGEYGALVVNNSYKTSTLAWTTNFIDNCDLYNYAPVLWDTGSGCFYDKQNAKIQYPELEKFFKEHALDKENKNYKKVQAAAQKNIEAALESAKAPLGGGNSLVGRTDVGIGYLMYSDANWSVTYSVGDEYKPNSKSKGLVATDAEITGPGTYTVGLDFTGISAGKSSKFSFSAIGIANGEALFPGYVIDIKELKVNGKPVSLAKKGYTTTDDGKTTRINLYNVWVTKIPKGIRTVDGETKGVSAVIVDQNDPIFKDMQTLEIVFDYGPAK